MNNLWEGQRQPTLRTYEIIVEGDGFEWGDARQARGRDLTSAVQGYFTQHHVDFDYTTDDLEIQVKSPDGTIRKFRVSPETTVHFHIDDLGEVEPPWERNTQTTSDLLGLVEGSVGGVVTPEALDGLTDAQLQELEAWAGAIHLRASDNDDVVVPPRPDFLTALVIAAFTETTGG